MLTLDITAEQWREQARSIDTESHIRAVAGLADDEHLSADELVAAHLPLAVLVGGFASAHQERWRVVSTLAPAAGRARPFLVGVTGGVAAGKTVTSSVLATLIEASGARVGVVSTDGFLLPNRELERRGLADRKGFPESYDHEALITFLGRVRDPGRASGESIPFPLYDHVRYDVTATGGEVAADVEVVIIEGVNVLQPDPSGRTDAADFLDLSIYLDAAHDDIRAWFLQRLQRLRAESATDPDSFFSGFAGLSDDAFVAMGEAVWAGINGPNLVDHIAPSRARADIVMERGPDHAVARVQLRVG